jgi:hypothetical protein
MAAISAAQAQTKQDGEVVHNLPQAFAAASNKHDGHKLAPIMAEDVDFVTVGATMVAEKRAGGWLVVASQNDGSFPGVAPEFEGITSPMPMPDQVGSQPSDP